MDFDSQHNPFAAPETQQLPEVVPAATINLPEIASAQRNLVLAILISLSPFVIRAFSSTRLGQLVFMLVWFIPILLVLAFFLRIHAVVRLSRAVGYGIGWRIAFMILMISTIGTKGLLGLLALGVMLRINSRATTILNSHGIPVGLFGVARDDLSLVKMAQTRIGIVKD